MYWLILHSGADLEPLLQALHDPLNPAPPAPADTTTPTPPNPFDTAVEQVANRVYCVQHAVGFEGLSPGILYLFVEFLSFDHLK